MTTSNTKPTLAKTFIIGTIFIIFAFFLFSSFSSQKQNENQPVSNSDKFPQDYKIVTPKIPNDLEFCGEPVPVYNFEVYERLEREFIVNTYWHSLTILTLKRANRWFPVIEPILKKNNIPDDFKYLCVTESTLLNLISPANAVGFWQFLKSAATRYDLEVNNEVDERYSVEKATEAACKYLQESYAKYGSWTMAAASYNMGVAGVNEQLDRQKTNNYYNLVLNEETSRYVFRVIATKVMMNNPKEYGFDIKPEELYKPFETYEVDVNSAVPDWATFAKDNGVNYKILKMYNPWLRENYLTNKAKKLYKIKLPVEGSIEVIPELD
ncbi:MAG: lytic transglycosylase domain-containing protein [Ignavibacteriales bacterium]|nr:lytic transglycosylase domain-containing protein [Ignavibacteriales bacterium]MCB9217952.1 lytic transglycosylase domain-containing protein [Ignavibacteriales bacterium]